MKQKFKNGILMLFVLFTFTYCTEENQFNNNNDKNNIDLNKYGFYHNESIILYFNNLNSSKKAFGKQTIESTLNKMADVMKSKYPNEFKNIDLDLIMTFYNKLENKTTLNKNANSKGVQNTMDNIGSESLKDNVIEVFSSEDKNTNLFVNFLTDVYNNNDISYDEIMSKFNEYSDGSEEFIVFESILQSSNELWTTSDSQSKSSMFAKVEDQCGTGSILVDAGIGALTWWAGGAGILGAGLGSAIYNENCNAGNP